MSKRKLYFNLLHRAGSYDENFKILQLQQDVAHEHNLNCTVVIAYDALFVEKIVNKIKYYQSTFGDEVGLLLNSTDPLAMLNCNYFFWLFSKEEKRKIIRDSMEKFKSVFGAYPKLLTTYYLDAPTINFIHENYPEVESVFASCFEEGTRVFRGTNYKCYLFSEGGPWSPWIPSRQNSQCPAAGEEDDAGVLAFPHLSRDMLLSIEDRNDFFASHPQNITRGWAYKDNQWPYLYNFFDMNVLQSTYNDGYYYTNMYVDPNWLMPLKKHDDDIRVEIYKDAIRYIAELKERGELIDMRVTEFSRWFRKNRGYNKPDVVLWKDILCGSEKQVFWYIDAHMRVLLDPVQGGSLVDLRPYVARLERPVGVDEDLYCDGSYPYILNAQYRGGEPTYNGSNSMFTGAVAFKEKTEPFWKHWTTCSYERGEDCSLVKLSPIKLEMDGVKIEIQTETSFYKNGLVKVTRRLSELSEAEGEIELEEYFNGCFGTTEYPTDLREVKLSCVSEQGMRTIQVRYSETKVEEIGAVQVMAEIPSANTLVTIHTNMRDAVGILFDGMTTGPMYTVGMRGRLKRGEECSTWLKVQKLQ